MEPTPWSIKLHEDDMDAGRWEDGRGPMLHSLLDSFISTLVTLEISSTYLGESEHQAVIRRQNSNMIDEMEKILARVKD